MDGYAFHYSVLSVNMHPGCVTEREGGGRAGDGMTVYCSYNLSDIRGEFVSDIPQHYKLLNCVTWHSLIN